MIGQRAERCSSKEYPAVRLLLGIQAFQSLRKEPHSGKPMSRLASLTYDAAAERLSGHIPGVGMNGCIDVKAYSGGSRGHSKVKPETAKILRHFEAQSFNSRYANTRTIGEGTDKDPYKQRGGTLPAGHYSCKYHANHPIFHECIRLTRHADTHIRYLTMSGAKLDNRGDDFFIHDLRAAMVVWLSWIAQPGIHSTWRSGTSASMGL